VFFISEQVRGSPIVIEPADPLGYRVPSLAIRGVTVGSAHHADSAGPDPGAGPTVSKEVV
jgi:hypothetical protein